MNKMLLQLGINAKEAENTMRTITTDQKNQVLAAVADHLIASTDKLLEANAVDVANAKQNHMPEGLVDRLMLSPERIEGMAEGLRQLVALEDPIGEVTGMKKRPNGLLIGQKRVPLGVVGIIYEARPNVTADAFGLCFKTGNVVILKGGSDAIHSNEAIVDCIRESLKACGKWMAVGKKRGSVAMMRQQKTVVSYGRAYVIRQKNRRRRRKYKWLCMGIGLLFVLVFLLKPNVQAVEDAGGWSDRVRSLELAGYLQAANLTPEETRRLLLPELQEYVTTEDVQLIFEKL